MSNNPGKRGKPAPWTIRERDDREVAFRAYKTTRHPAYAEHVKKRSEAFSNFRVGEGFAAIELANKRLRAWDRQNPNPMTWEQERQLEAEFDATYIATDRS